MLDLFHTLQELQAWDSSLVAQTGLQFDLRSAQGKLIASLMAALAEFERDMLRKQGMVFGRRPGRRIKADRFTPKVLKLVSEGQSYREKSEKRIRDLTCRARPRFRWSEVRRRGCIAEYERGS